MKSWHIWDFPDNIYISLKRQAHKEFFREMFIEYGGKRAYARFLGLSQTAVKQHWRGYSKKGGRLYTQCIPLWVLKKSCKTNRLKRKIENNINLIKGSNKSNPITNPKLPIEENPELYRITAHMIADGSAPRNKVPYYSNTSKVLREQFKKDLKIFGKMRVYDSKLTIPIVYFPKILTDILSHILNVRFSFPNRLPSETFKATEECKRAFLQALFDDEGYISTGLCISMSNLKVIKQIKKLLKAIEVETNKIGIKRQKYRKNNFIINVKKKHYKRFDEKVGFSHPEKSRNLKFALKTLNRKIRTRDPYIIKEEILKYLRRKPMKTLELANNIQLSLGHCLRHLKSIEKMGDIERTGFKNKIIWYLP
ncbi:hypothetical protein HYX17_03425 [Candidatus Woesearchaeota archaeon]|nr:hypothetical protein [Candidatus Woesearchaeota archaeon]